MGVGTKVHFSNGIGHMTMMAAMPYMTNPLKSFFSGVTVYLAPLNSLPPGGQAVPGYLAPHPGYLHPPGGKLSRPVYLAPRQHK